MEQEQINLCGYICWAASKLGLGIGLHEKAYYFLDNMVGVMIKGEPNEDKQLALLSCCQSLEKYFNTQVVDNHVHNAQWQ